MEGGLHMADLNVNGKTHQVDVDPNTPLLWVLRDTIGLTGTKYGCGIAQCGACTVHVDGIAMRSCSVPLSAVAGRQITTIEGLAQNGALHKVQKAWLDHDVPQCGYCQCGMIMAVAALLKDKPKPSDADIDANITNICRCGTFQQVRAAIHAAAARRPRSLRLVPAPQLSGSSAFGRRAAARPNRGAEASHHWRSMRIFCWV